jgi:hypothetical protein
MFHVPDIRRPPLCTHNWQVEQAPGWREQGVQERYVVWYEHENWKRIYERGLGEKNIVAVVIMLGLGSLVAPRVNVPMQAALACV